MDYALRIANKGYKNAFKDDPGLSEGLNVWHGHITNKNVAIDLKAEYCPLENAIA
jgi:alanine dehydrogenase